MLSSIYRPPNSDIPTFLASYNSLLSAIKRTKPTSIIVGLDHNLDFLKSSKHQWTVDFIQNNLDFGLIPTVTRPTRITNSSATLIDNVFVSQNLCGSYVSNILLNDTSDHLPTVCCLSNLKTNKCAPLYITSRDTRPKNLLALKQQLSEHDWTYELSPDSVSDCMKRVHQTLTERIEYCIPVREHTVNVKQQRREPWLTAGLKVSIGKNKRLYSKMLHGCVTKEKYTEYNKTLRNTIRRTKLQFYQEMCNRYKSQTKKLWGLINEIAGKTNDKSNLVEYLKIDDVKEYNAKKICNSFGKYFASVGKKFADKIPKPEKSIASYLKLLQNSNKSIYLYPTDENELKKLVSDLPAKSSHGHDNISNILLKDIFDQISNVLCIVFNNSLLTGEFPDIMKIAEVVPLYKGKEHYYESNYRPISLLSTISKILEKVVYKRVYKFLSDTNQIYENQYGFREKHSCEHAIGQVIGKLVKGLENNMYGACVLLDLSKAFDTIEHSILLKKLELYGVQGNALKWFESYLSNRTIRVKCRTVSDSSETKSEDFVVTHGTPQGSCLGPLIFLIFVNDLHFHLNDSECIQFADDTTLVFVHRNLKYLHFCIQQRAISGTRLVQCEQINAKY